MELINVFHVRYYTARDASLVECCFTSTETVGLLGTGAQDGHLDFHTAPELDVALGDLHGVEKAIERGGGGPYCPTWRSARC